MPALLLHTAPVSPAAANPRLPSSATAARRRTSSSRHTCRAQASSGGSWTSDYDLYELLGVEPSSPHSQIKAAYRSLQKRCHPDVAAAGATEGHDMAVVLNEVYALLSDPGARLAYDRERARRSEFAGYTGRPLYSSWRGGDAERRAVFVDEVACVGCLKCALLAGRTFAVESAHGRARVVAQWADPEDKIRDAIHACPVDCISMVERSDLAALEFLMSKQPRGRVRVSEGSVAAGGKNIFAEVDKFQKRFQDMKQKSATRESQDSETVRESRTSAFHAIMSMSNWWYWRPSGPAAPATTTTVLSSRLLLPPPPPPKTTPPPTSSTADPVTDRLQEAAAARRKAGGASTAARARRDEYWAPRLDLPSSASPPSIHERGNAAAPRGRRRAAAGDAAIAGPARRKGGMSIDLTVPLLMAIVSAGVVGYNGEETVAGGGGVQQHVGGVAAIGVVNSFGMKIMLAGITWFVIGAAITSLIQLVVRREEDTMK